MPAILSTATEQPTETTVRLAPGLTQDSLLVTLLKDAGRPLEDSAAGK